jgi:aryl-alcohol dehydrogenase-like predicted oxidoreductase
VATVARPGETDPRPDADEVGTETGGALQERPVRLGGSEVEVSPLGTGAWAWGDRLTWGYGRDYGEGDCRGAFAASLGAGLTLFDTAELYGWGESERLLGRFIRERGLRPETAVVATKFFPYPWRLRHGDVVAALRGSLGRLGLPRVDVYQLHVPLPVFSVERRMDALAETVQAGLTRAVGVSNYNAADLRRAHAALARRGIPLASNQVHYSLLHRSPERNGVLAACRELNVTLMAYSPLEQGLLTGKYGPGRPPPARRRRAAPRPEALGRLVAALRAAGEAHGGKTPAQVALNWLLGRGALPIPGAKRPDQARDNAGALGWRLTPEEVETLDRLSR